jgi:spore coat protein CotF
MLQDNMIALDWLMWEKSSIIDLTSAALECSNQNLKQVLMQMRSQNEQSHQEIYHIAERTGGYLASEPADQQMINRVSNFYQQFVNQVQPQYTGYTTGNVDPFNPRNRY